VSVSETSKSTDVKVAACTSLEVPLALVLFNNADALIPATADVVHVNK